MAHPNRLNERAAYRHDSDGTYSDAEREFMVAMERFKRDRRRPYPDARDVLAVAHALGYRKVNGGHHAD